MPWAQTPLSNAVSVLTLHSGFGSKHCMLQAASIKADTCKASVACVMQEMVDACLTSGKFSGSVDFTGHETSKKGKMMSNCQTREALDWQPKYSSFEDFMAAGANDFYNTSPLYSAKPAA